MTAGRLTLLAIACLFISACANPVSTVRVDPKKVYGQLSRSAVATGEPSTPTRNVLQELGLLEAFEKKPEAALADLHKAMVSAGGDLDALFALAELSFLQGLKSAKREYHLAAAAYAWAFLFPEEPDRAPARFDPRLRLAADIYNWALADAFLTPDRSEVVPAAGTFALPFGRMDISFDKAALRIGDREMYGFVPTAEIEVRGLEMRYRRPGIGAPLAAAIRPVDPARPEGELLAPRVKVPATALLRMPNARGALVRSQPLTAALELHLAWEAESVSIAGEPVPLEADPSAALAFSFTGIPIVELEMLGLLGRVPALFATRPPLISGTPYKPGLIPAVFVHGTESSVVRWAEMYNRLVADPDLRSRYQFWFFQYDSGNPIALSSLRLRDALTTTLARIDPNGADPALRNLLLIGHSQGGLLVKMQVVDTGDRLWNAVSRKPLADLDLSPETRDLLQRGLFVEPVPQVTRVVFICTPQRGSFVAGRELIANLVRRLLDFPKTITGLTADLARNANASVSPFVPTAVDNMSPRSPFIHGLQNIPVVSRVKAHSIIAVEGDGPVEQGDDGVVKYSSAHIEPVESELVVKSSHSTQGNPHTIEEVRRILRLHAGLP
jgi:hypothetical protein